MDERLFHLTNGLAKRYGFVDGAMLFFAKYGLIILIATLFTFWLKKKKAFMASLVSMLISWEVNQLISFFYFKPRPFSVQGVNPLLSHSADASFPSDHAAVGFAIAMSVFLENKLWGWFLIILASLVSLARVWCGLHYPLDIICGAMIGTGVSLGIYKLTLSIKEMDKKKLKKAIKHWFGRIALKIVYFLVGIIPVKFIYPLGNWIGTMGYWLSRRYRKIALENLEIVFGKELTLSQRRKLAKESFRNMVKCSLETMAYSYNGNMNPVRNFVFPFNIGISNRMKDKITIEGKEYLNQTLAKGKGAIGLTAHFGNFPLLGARLAQEGYKVNYVVRRMKDKSIEDYFQLKRDNLRINWIMSQPRKECVEACLERLNKNQFLLLQMDQNFSKGGVFVDFFGKQAATATGPVIFALRTGAEILPIFIVRQKDETHKIYINPPILLEIKADRKQTVLINTAKLTKVIESYVRRYPSQWGWIHRRWKDRPTV
jgi:KDO2-lipid IV(A) lauroyltransferase